MAETYIVGLELNEKDVRICIYDPGEKDAVTVMVTAGGSRAECPAHMAYIEETGQWKYGIEADYFAEQKNALLIDDVFTQACASESFKAEQKSFDTDIVLSQLIRQALMTAGVKEPEDQIRSLMITVPYVTKILTQNVEKAFKRIGFRQNQAYLQNYDESFYIYTYYQKPELYSRNVGLFYFPDETCVEFRKLHSEQTTKPTTVTVESSSLIKLSPDHKTRDVQFGDYIKECTANTEYSGFFLVGSGFDRQWSKNSLGLLCRAQRKVFYGNNLFTKGACFAAREKTAAAQIRSSVFLGNDLVRKNIGIEMLVDGIAVYYPLITAGIHWYEAEKECDIILNDENNIVFRVSRMEDGKRTNYSMPLTGLPERPPKTTRIKLKLRFESAKKCVITAEDMGFGEIFASSNLKWSEIL